MEHIEKKKVEKHTILITVISTLTLLIAIIGATFAFFAAKIVGNEEASSVLIKSSATITIEYKTTNEINETDIKPGFKRTLNFTINNSSGGTAGYKLFWTIGKNGFVNNDLVYSLTATSNGSNDNFVTASNVPIPETSREIEGAGTIPNGNMQSYSLEIKFLDKNVNQDENKNKEFAGKIEVRSN